LQALRVVRGDVHGVGADVAHVVVIDLTGLLPLLLVASGVDGDLQAEQADLAVGVVQRLRDHVHRDQREARRLVVPLGLDAWLRQDQLGCGKRVVIEGN
jgi:hypothetical protein